MWARHRLEWVTAVVAAVAAAVHLLLPPLGSDLSAQVARADFFAAHGYAPIDLRWYGGVNQLGYSLLSQPVMALLGVRVTGALALVASATLLAALLRRTGAARPWLGALVGTACIAGNLVSGRVTYALGVALGLAALVALTAGHGTRPADVPVEGPGPDARRRTRPPARPAARRIVVAAAPAVLALLAASTSPVVALFLGLAGVALLLAGRRRDGLLIAVPAAVPLAVAALLFGDGGWMNISRTDAVRAVVASLAVAALVPARPVRIGGVLSALGVLAAALIHTPVGLNATRLAVMFTLPLLAAYATRPGIPPQNQTRSPGSDHSRHFRRWEWERRSSAAGDRRWARRAAVALLLVAAFWWQPPVVFADVRDIGNPTADREFFAPLRARLAQEPRTGRVEIPPTRDYWEAAHLGDVPLARGWLRQADIDRNPLFFADIPGARGTGVRLTADSYRVWLGEQAVQFVAVPDADFSWLGRPEVALIDSGLPYLTEIWRDPHWRLYAVADPQPIVAAPARLVDHTAAAVVVDAPAAGDVPIRVRYYRWLTASDGATVARAGDWTVVHVPGPGRYTLSSGGPLTPP